jgi:hypothetical protein
MSVFATFFLLSAWLTGEFLLKKIRRIDGCFIGACLVIVNLLGLGCLDYVKDTYNIIALSFLFQIIGGIGNGIITPSAMAVLSGYKE